MIDYVVESNALTKPPSYSCRTIPGQTLGLQEMAKLINLHNRTIPAQTAEDALNLFFEEILSQLTNGNWVNIEGFASFRATIKARLDGATDPLPAESVDCVVVVSKPFVDELKSLARYNRNDYSELRPNMLSVIEPVTGLESYIVDESGLVINGNNLQYNPLASDEGVFIGQEDVILKATNVSLAEPSKIIIIPNLDPFDPVPAVGYDLYVRTRYTPNGNLRQRKFKKKLREMVELNVGGKIMNYDTVDIPVTVDSYDGVLTELLFFAFFDNKKRLLLGVTTVDSYNLSITTEITNSPGYQSYKLYGLDQVVEGQVRYDLLSETLTLYSNYIQELCTLNGFGPVLLSFIQSTGQDFCYDSSGILVPCAGTGQDAEFQPGTPLDEPRFSDNGDGTITDLSTGLIWCKDASIGGAAQTWTDSLTLAENAQDGMYGLSDGSVPGDWRMPNYNELRSILVPSFAEPSVSNIEGTAPNGSSGTDSFSNLVNSTYWTSTSDSLLNGFSRDINLGYGQMSRTGKTSTNMLMIVKGSNTGEIGLLKTGATVCYDAAGLPVPCVGTGQDAEFQYGYPLPSPRFTNNGDGTVTDNATERIWSESMNHTGTRVTWQAALDAANATPGFRLPTVNELLSVIDISRNSPCIDNDNGAITTVQADFEHWTSTTYGVTTLRNYAFSIDMTYGDVSSSGKSNIYWVWLIKEE